MGIGESALLARVDEKQSYRPRQQIARQSLRCSGQQSFWSRPCPIRGC